MGVCLKLDNMMGEAVKRSWLVTLHFMTSKYEYSKLLNYPFILFYITMSIIKTVAIETLQLRL